MKKNKYLIFLLLLIIPLNVKAEVYINCKSPVKKDETFSCDVSVFKDKIKEFSLTAPEDTSHVKYVGVSSLGLLLIIVLTEILNLIHHQQVMVMLLN